ncbi:MAG: hypothetical protein A2161_18870 [Candidatus Schekmanbacteria bacterium RBG_13_48_7]|uniref:DUF4878 domain-containing protein n=1 Tax=Candidatus Schekmanbacteria bacterium RBG_13_48_7 TaxID=1817878 RepID=A0A1F7RUL9_9BACT|nr:MAG: hypothetical protein A2161_18870 [Candidatus Schekmanbacteria bacterium RBG_13_48_7]
MKKIFCILLAGVIVLIYIFFIHKSPAEKLIHAGIKNIAEENIPALMELVSPEFKGENGSTFNDLPEILKLLFDTFDQIKVIVAEKNENEIDENKQIIVTLHYKVIANRGDQRVYLVGNPMNTEVIRFVLCKENKHWKICSASGYKLNKEELKELKNLF